MIYGLGIRVWGSDLRVAEQRPHITRLEALWEGLGFRAWGLGFGV